MDHFSKEQAAVVIARAVWRWGGWTFPVALALAVRALPDESARVDALVAAFVPAIAQGALTLAVCILITWAAYLGWERLPGTRFHRMAGEIDDIRIGAKNSDADKPLMEASSFVSANAKVLMFKSDRLRISHPTLDNTGKEWERWAARLRAAAQAREYRASRDIWSDMEKEQRS